MEQRLALLHQANVISHKAYQGCMAAVTVIDKQLGIAHDNEQYQMAMTHLSRAADRIWQQEPVEEGLDADVLEEIYQDPTLDRVLDIHQKTLSAMALSCVPQSEESFMIANIYALVQTSLEEQS
ncbi:hypothetical protein [Vibrio sp. LaRot3]|uniref:hypothetical protein n=1 Tax=Vibrio sp. LaRot3 TaxID=2998829 RepID=UPI0022CE34FB|nr:hypothetical protein [Vibrio sp. LaRot3]MDA0149800.1 hypothetical protein [Vibrio sp. LaRot3]